MKKAYLKTMTIAAAVLFMTGCGQTAYNQVVESEVPRETVSEETAPPFLLEGASYAALGKREESVTVTADPTGSPETITVETRLSDIGEGEAVSDFTNLTEIKNRKGDEAWVEKEGEIVWQNLGEDIVYEGTLERELPVKLSITYYLEGKEISPEELAGKSGHVKIRFDYENLEQKDGFPVPFVCVSTVMLPSDVFSGIEVKNGSLMTMDDTNLAVGMAFPGLWESLAKDPKKGEPLPDYVEIEADAKKFELNFTATLISNGLFSEEEEEDKEEERDETLEALLGVPLPDLNAAKDKMEELSDMAENLKKKLSSLKGLIPGLPNLSSGISLEGLSDFQDFSDAVDDLKERFQKLKEADRSYTAFAGTDETAESSVHFVVETEEIKAGE